MARRSRRFDAGSIIRYIAKTEKLYKANTDDPSLVNTQVHLATYNWIAGQGGYVGLREKVSDFLDSVDVPRALRLPFFAMAQKLLKLKKEKAIRTEADFEKVFNMMVSRYFVEGTELYRIATGEFKNMMKEGMVPTPTA